MEYLLNCQMRLNPVEHISIQALQNFLSGEYSGMQNGGGIGWWQ